MKYKTLSAEKYCEFVTDGTHDSPKTRETGRFLITSKHLGRYEIDFSSAKLISERDYQKVIERSRVEKWDILFSMIGTIGNLYIETNDITDYACKNMGIFKLGGNEKKAKWLYYYLQTPKIKEYVLSISRGTTQGYVPLNALRSLPVEFPNDNTRDRVSNILWNIDEKIKTNIAINKNLEEQLTALHKNFIETSECSVVTIANIAEKVAMGPFGSNIKVSTFVEKGVPIISGNHIRGHFLDEPEFNYITEEHAAKLKNSIVYPHDIIFTHAGNIGQVAMIPDDSNYEYYMLSQRQFYLRCDESKVVPEYVLFFFHSPEGQHELLSYANQTGVPSIAQPATNLKKIEIPLPSYSDQIKWKTLILPLIAEYLNNRQESICLSKIRDTLLPRLMSGEIDVGNVEV